MPTKTSSKTSKRRPPSGEILLGHVFPTEKMAQAARRKALKERAVMDEVYALADLTTLKHPKREHQANFELFDARKALVDLSKSGWTAKDAGRVLLIKKLVERGKFSDFPGQRQYAGIQCIGNLGDPQ